ncbi:hypothetical protein D9C73_020261 [Collichthys lucidus]|uniref:BED-type domain-containing protein n=1 Tax=Collichthys lucidus TaxID=240159 RepID=A0A4U5VDG5_COLLU|nr:hypothetical protein D9C73_020261 [Collichthys lucidus]
MVAPRSTYHGKEEKAFPRYKAKKTKNSVYNPRAAIISVLRQNPKFAVVLSCIQILQSQTWWCCNTVLSGNDCSKQHRPVDWPAKKRRSQALDLFNLCRQGNVTATCLISSCCSRTCGLKTNSMQEKHGIRTELGRKKRLDPWSHFHYLEAEKRSQCLVLMDGNMCGKKIAGKNTTNLKRHINLSHPNIKLLLNTIKNQTKIRGGKAATFKEGPREEDETILISPSL